MLPSLIFIRLMTICGNIWLMLLQGVVLYISCHVWFEVVVTRYMYIRTCSLVSYDILPPSILSVFDSCYLNGIKIVCMHLRQVLYVA